MVGQLDIGIIGIPPAPVVIYVLRGFAGSISLIGQDKVEVEMGIERWIFKNSVYRISFRTISGNDFTDRAFITKIFFSSRFRNVR